MRVLITRPRAQSEALASELAAHGIDVGSEPVLEIRYRTMPDVNLSRIQAVLVTSANGARALAAATDRREVPVYAVGDATGAALHEAGFTRVESASGDATALAALVSERLDPKAGPLLHVSGSAVAGDLAKTLSDKGFFVRRVVLYDAEPVAALSPQTALEIRSGDFDAVLFFSPRSAQAFVRLARAADLEAALGGIDAICLSPAVAEAAAQAPWRRTLVVERPDRQAVVDLIVREAQSGSAATAEGDEGRSTATHREGQTVNGDDRKKTEATEAQSAETQPSGEADSTLGAEPAAAGDQAAAETERRSPWGAERAEEKAPDESAEPGSGDEVLEGGEKREPEPPAQEEQPAAARETEAPPREVVVKRRGGGFALFLSFIALLLGAAALASLWQAGLLPLPWRDEARPSLQAIEQELADMEGRLQAPPEPAAPAPALEERLSALEAEVEALEPVAPPPDVEPLEQRLEEVAGRIETLAREVAALEQPGDVPSDIVDRLDRVEQRIADREGLGQRADSLARQLDSLAQRVDSLESAVPTDEGVGERLTQQGETLARLERRVVELADTVSARAGLTDRLSSLQNRLSTIESELAEDGQAAAMVPALLLALGQLRTEVESGEPYAEALAAVTALGADLDKQALSALRAHASSGVPTVLRLKERFDAMAREVAQAAAAPEGAAWYERAIAEVMGAVTVRRTGAELGGDDPEARLARAEARLRANDLAGAVEALSGLEGAPAEAAGAWLADARARLAVERALAGLTTAVLAKLGDGGAASPSEAAAGQE